jgi:hypothetical protein
MNGLLLAHVDVLQGGINLRLPILALSKPFAKLVKDSFTSVLKIVKSQLA